MGIDMPKNGTSAPPSEAFPREGGERECTLLPVDLDPRPSASSGQAPRGGENNSASRLHGRAPGESILPPNQAGESFEVKLP
jgi:hypothetical protein